MKIYGFIVLKMSSATTCPEIKDGGTPGPGVVNCPVNHKFFMCFDFNFGFKKAVCNNVFAKPYAFPLNAL